MARRGSAYVMVLACATIVAAISLGGLALSRAQRDSYTAQEDVRRARAGAASALELCTGVLSPTVAGRGLLGADPGLPKVVDDASVGFVFSDPVDGILTDDILESVEVVVESRSGSARQFLAGTLTPRFAPVGMASYALGATGGVRLTNSTVSAAAGVYAGTKIDATGSMIDAPAFSVGAISGSTYLGTQARVDEVTAPDITDPTGLIAAATKITYNSISGGRIDKVVLSPSLNPFGAATNPRGIYVIDCGGQRLRIRQARIIGTLIVLNAASDSIWENSVSITTADPRLPAVVWQGDLTVSTEASDLTEADASANLNPVGAPYMGQTDSDKADSYPSLVTGTMIVVGDLTVDKALSVEGRVLVVGNVTADKATITVRSDPDNAMPDCLFAPDGFALEPGSVRRVVDGN